MVIVGYIQLLSETELTEEQEDFSNEAAKSADLLLYLIMIYLISLK